MNRNMHEMGRRAKAALRVCADFIWPTRSILTGQRHGGHAPVPGHDFSRLTFLHDSGCRTCAMPIAINPGGHGLCAVCAVKPPLWNQARAAVVYDDTSKQAILGLKHAGFRDGLSVMSTWMSLSGQDILDDSDWLIPVPLHYTRLVQRGFNQAGWLAQGISRLCGVPVLVDGLCRTRKTRSQGGLNARERQRNVSGAFAARQKRIKHITDSTVTLVDDVFTTGATLTACTRALRRAGARRVNILVLARVAKPQVVS